VRDQHGLKQQAEAATQALQQQEAYQMRCGLAATACGRLGALPPLSLVTAQVGRVSWGHHPHLGGTMLA
jgi:hypothetical protein